jgi:molecular chaperone GrpE
MKKDVKIVTDNDQLDETDLLATAQAKAEEYLAGWQRALADYQNLQLKSKQQTALTSELTRAAIFSDLTPIIDNFNKALVHVPDSDKNSDWVIGLSHIKQQLIGVCQQHGLELIIESQIDFDPNIHEAIGYQPSDQGANKVIEVVAVGLRLGERIIKPAKVIVST